jgi:hypothetical protein
MAELNARFIKETVAPRVLKAVIWGSVMYIILYQVPSMLIPRDLPLDILPFDLNAQLFEFASISVFFAVVGQLLSKTIIGCGFGIAKSIILILFFLALSEGGIFSVDIPAGEIMFNVTVDVCVILVMVVSVNLLNIAKNLLEAIKIFSEKSAEPDFK